MPLALQAKILRVLQEQVFERVGGNETIRTDVRLIAATNRDLKAWSAEGKFRPDLYYRLSVFTIHLPPLRERGDDLPLLVQHFVRRFSRELGRDVREVAPEALERLRSYSWPGNIRELQSVLKQALLQAAGPGPAPGVPARRSDRGRRRAHGGEAAPRFRPGTTLSDMEREAIQQCLFQTGGNRQRTADLLGISTAHAAAQDPRIPAGRPPQATRSGRRRSGRRGLTTHAAGIAAGRTIRRALPSRGRTECRTPAGMRHPVRSRRPGDGRVIDARAGHPCGNLFAWSAAAPRGTREMVPPRACRLKGTRAVAGPLRDPPSRHPICV